MKQYITIGTVAKPQGIRGEIKVTPLTDNNERFFALKYVIIDNTEYKVTHARVVPQGVYLSLEGVYDRNAAELLRGKDLSVRRNDAVKSDSERYFIVDIIGCKIADDKGAFATVKDVLQYGSGADVFEATMHKGGYISFPALSDVIEKIDVENSMIYVNRKRLDEVALYED